MALGGLFCMYTNLKFPLILFTFLFIAVFTSLEFAHSESSDDGMVTLTGNIICLYPETGSKNVEPRISATPCHGEKKHLHFFFETTRRDEKLYAIEGSPEAIKKLQESQKRKNIQLTGKITGNQRAWVITVD